MCDRERGKRGRLVLIAHRKLSGHLLGSLMTAAVVDGCCGGLFCEDEAYSKPGGGYGEDRKCDCVQR